MELLPVILVVFETSRVFKVWVEIHGFDKKCLDILNNNPEIT